MICESCRKCEKHVVRRDKKVLLAGQGRRQKPLPLRGSLANLGALICGNEVICRSKISEPLKITTKSLFPKRNVLNKLLLKLNQLIETILALSKSVNERLEGLEP